MDSYSVSCLLDNWSTAGSDVALSSKWASWSGDKGRQTVNLYPTGQTCSIHGCSVYILSHHEWEVPEQPAQNHSNCNQAAGCHPTSPPTTQRDSALWSNPWCRNTISEGREVRHVEDDAAEVHVMNHVMNRKKPIIWGSKTTIKHHKTNTHHRSSFMQSGKRIQVKVKRHSLSTWFCFNVCQAAKPNLKLLKSHLQLSSKKLPRQCETHNQSHTCSSLPSLFSIQPLIASARCPLTWSGVLSTDSYRSWLWSRESKQTSHPTKSELVELFCAGEPVWALSDFTLFVLHGQCIHIPHVHHVCLYKHLLWRYSKYMCSDISGNDVSIYCTYIIIDNYIFRSTPKISAWSTASPPNFGDEHRSVMPNRAHKAWPSQRLSDAGLWKVATAQRYGGGFVFDNQVGRAFVPSIAQKPEWSERRIPTKHLERLFLT